MPRAKSAQNFEAATCRVSDCKAPILWAHTGERWIPLDAEPEERGNIMLSGGNPPRARVLSGQELATARKAKVRLYRAHARSCTRGSVGRAAA